MIDYQAERLHQLRNLRLFSFIVALLCALALGAPAVVEDMVLIIFCAFFILRFLEYSTRIHDLELDAEDLPVRERRR